ncbi:isopeptide-forming domain-containing fimbrial protein [Enterococcus sp. N342-3-1-2]
MNTWRKILVGCLFFLLTVFGCSQFANAVETKTDEIVTITLRDILMEYEESDDQQHTMGEELLKQFQGINDETFELFNVTAEWMEFLKEQSPNDIASDHIKQLFAANISKDIDSLTAEAIGTTHTVNGVSGQLDFEVRSKTEGHDSAFLIQPINKNKNPILIVLPIINEDGSALTHIFVYMKSLRSMDVPPALTKTIVDPKNSYQYGDKVNFETQLIIPSTIMEAKSFLLTDIPDAGVSILLDTIAVDSTTGIPSDSYTIRQNGRGFSIQFSPSALKKYIGQTVTITYRMQVEDSQVQTTYFENLASLYLDDHLILEAKTGVYIGGKHFMKIDAISKQPLQGAAFLVKNHVGAYLIKKEGGYQWVNGVSEDNRKYLVKLVSDDNGLFSVNGLQYGKYLLEEETAPKGYIKSNQEITFDITKGTYEAADQLLHVVNKKAAQPQAASPSGNLPQTNERDDKRIMFLGVFVVLLIGSIQISRKEKE